MRHGYKLPYEIKEIDGKTKYKISEGRWVSRQRAHQIYRGYKTGKVSEFHRDYIDAVALEEQEKGKRFFKRIKKKEAGE